VVDPCCETGNPDLVAEDELQHRGRRRAVEQACSPASCSGFYRETDNLIDISLRSAGLPRRVHRQHRRRRHRLGRRGDRHRAALEVFGVTFDYTHTEVEASGSNQQIQDIPRDLAKLILTATSPAAGSAAARR
jgi:hypothetical protein